MAWTFRAMDVPLNSETKVVPDAERSGGHTLRPSLVTGSCRHAAGCQTGRSRKLGLSRCGQFGAGETNHSPFS